MDILTDPRFWGEAMLAAASRLAVLAAVVWVARLAVRPRAAAAGHVPGAPELRKAERKRESTTGTAANGIPFRYIELKRPPERKPEPVPAGPAQPIDPLRQRLLEYLERRESERTPA